ncbi:hypothetical protein PLICRDRAFT_124585 [Plicaturopsis crispa FD-325 SS-3]|nr:hypothetical protein PLICRDRAFT_124585 [Plicaturopsis crispa FD-325 SS-3]
MIRGRAVRPSTLAQLALKTQVYRPQPRCACCTPNRTLPFPCKESFRMSRTRENCIPFSAPSRNQRCSMLSAGYLCMASPFL